VRKTDNQVEALKLSIDNDVATAQNNFRSAIADGLSEEKYGAAETYISKPKEV
jgi:hypothetical protein